MDHFELHSEYAPTGDQPQAIEKLVQGFKEGNHNKRPTIRYFLKNILFKYPTGAIGEVFLTILSQLLIILQIFLSVNVFIAYS